MLKKILLVLAVSATLTACGPTPEQLAQTQRVAAAAEAASAALAKQARDEAAQAKAGVLEENRARAKSNSEFNAQLYKAANPRFTSDFSIISRADTAQGPECLQGDGWAELSIMRVEGKTVDKTVLMCSTYSMSIGCFRKEDFDKDKQLAGQDGACNRTIPVALPILKK